MAAEDEHNWGGIGTGIALGLGGLTALIGQWQVYRGGTTQEPEPFWNWLSALGIVLCLVGTVIAALSLQRQQQLPDVSASPDPELPSGRLPETILWPTPLYGWGGIGPDHPTPWSFVAINLRNLSGSSGEFKVKVIRVEWQDLSGKWFNRAFHEISLSWEDGSEITHLAAGEEKRVGLAVVSYIGIQNVVNVVVDARGITGGLQLFSLMLPTGGSTSIDQCRFTITCRAYRVEPSGSQDFLIDCFIPLVDLGMGLTVAAPRRIPDKSSPHGIDSGGRGESSVSGSAPGIRDANSTASASFPPPRPST